MGLHLRITMNCEHLSIPMVFLVGYINGFINGFIDGFMNGFTDGFSVQGAFRST